MLYTRCKPGGMCGLGKGEPFPSKEAQGTFAVGRKVWLQSRVMSGGMKVAHAQAKGILSGAWWRGSVSLLLRSLVLNQPGQSSK